MKITSIDYWRLHSLGQFENERIGLHAEVDPETENIFDCFKDLKATELSLQKEGYLIEESKKVAEAAEPKAIETPSLDEISSLRYENKESDKGPYKTASKTGNPNNPAFLKLQKYLQKHNNFAILYGYKLWNFQNSDTIGRRKQ